MSDTIVKKLYWSRYRPKTIEAMILLPRIENELVSDGKIILSGNYLFTGSSGNGKSSLARIIAGSNALIVNASFNSSVEDLKERVTEFCRTGDIFSDNGMKIVYLDEFDGVSAKYQEALRAFIEEHDANVRFVATCNNLSKISAAMLSRFNTICFDPKTEAEARFLREGYLERCMYIAEKNGIDINEEQMLSIINANFPDMRSVLNALQRIEKLGGYSSEVNMSTNTDFYKVVFSGVDPENTFNWVIETFGDNIDSLMKLCGRPLCRYIFSERPEYTGAVTRLTDLYKEYAGLFASGNIVDPVVLAVSYVYQIQEALQNCKK